MSVYDDYEYLDVVVSDGVAIVTLNGPEPGNALTPKGHVEMTTIFPRLTLDDRVDVAVLTGDRDAFCVGPGPEMVQEMLAGDPRVTMRVMAEVRELVVRGIDFEKPVVTALNGPAIGGALAFALLGDIIIAERQVSISDMHVVAAAAAGDGGVLFWPAAIGLLRAKRYLLTGEALSAEHAAELGLVTEVVDTGASLDRAMEFATRFAAMPKHALRHTKRALNAWLKMALPAYDLSWAGEIMTVGVPDAAEALVALAPATSHGRERNDER
jgi:enoyl-CoA hydratase